MVNMPEMIINVKLQTIKIEKRAKENEKKGEVKSKRARESFKIENAMCAISNHHFIVFVHTLRLFLVSFWPFDCCVCAHQIKSNNILTNVNSLAFYFIYLFSFLCVYFF